MGSRVNAANNRTVPNQISRNISNRLRFITVIFIMTIIIIIVIIETLVIVDNMVENDFRFIIIIILKYHLGNIIILLITVSWSSSLLKSLSSTKNSQHVDLFGDGFQ